MTALLDDPSIATRALALTTVALYTKMFAVAGVQGWARLKHKQFVRPEDAACFGDGTPAAQENPLAALAQHTLRNDLENIPMFLFLALLHTQLSAAPQTMLLYGPAFVLARTVHTLTYLRPTQPLRNRAYVLGQLICMALCGHLLHAVLVNP